MCFDGENIWVATLVNNNAVKLRASDGATLDVYASGPIPRPCSPRAAISGL